MRGLEMRNEMLEKQKKGIPTQENDYMIYFADARNYLERVKAKDPRRNKGRLGKTLFNMAYNYVRR